MNHSNSELLENHLKNHLKLLKITSITSKIIIFWDIFLENIIAFPFKHFDFFFTILKVQSSPKLKKGFKSIKVSIDDMDKMEENKIMEKRTFAKNTWYYRYDWLMNYITEPIKNDVWW